MLYIWKSPVSSKIILYFFILILYTNISGHNFGEDEAVWLHFCSSPNYINSRKTGTSNKRTRNMIKQVMICQIFSQASQIIFLTAISEKYLLCIILFLMPWGFNKFIVTNVTLATCHYIRYYHLQVSSHVRVLKTDCQTFDLSLIGDEKLCLPRALTIPSPSSLLSSPYRSLPSLRVGISQYSPRSWILSLVTRMRVVWHTMMKL